MIGWSKSRTSRKWRKRTVKTWQLLLLLIIFLTISVLALRHNNLTMVKLRNDVITADEKGVGTADALAELNEYIFKHMNTQVVRPIELVNTYNRQAQAVVESAQRGSGRDIYAEGTAACERRGIPLSSIAQCITNYANNNAASVAQKKITLPDKSLFTYSFSSPRWTPDLAGFSLLITVVISLWLLARLIEYIAVRLVVRHRLKNGL